MPYCSSFTFYVPIQFTFIKSYRNHFFIEIIFIKFISIPTSRILLFAIFCPYIMMDSSDYIPVKRKIYIKKMVVLEAENKALRKKLHVYEEIMKNKLNHTDHHDKDLLDVPYEIRKDAKSLLLKKNAITFLKNPTQYDYLINDIIRDIMTPKNSKHLDVNELRSFVETF